MDVLCKSRHGQIRIYISCYTSRPVVTAASQVSPFREHGNHYIQANIVFPVDADQCVFFRTLLDLSSRGKPYICTALGRAMFVPSFSNNRHNRLNAQRVTVSWRCRRTAQEAVITARRERTKGQGRNATPRLLAASVSKKHPVASVSDTTLYLLPISSSNKRNKRCL